MTIRVKNCWRNTIGSIILTINSVRLIPKALMKLTSIAPEKSSLTRHELQELVALTSKLITQLEVILTSKTVNLFSAFGISSSVASRTKPLVLLL